MSIEGIKPTKAGERTQGAFLAMNSENNKKKVEEQAVAFNFNGSGFVSPPANNIMGFGPASQKTETA